MKKNHIEIEDIIDSRIAELEEDYELDWDDINRIRLAIYKENGWNYDPFPEEDPDEEEEEESYDEEYRYKSLEELLNEVGLTMRVFL
ncbi:MAG: hypothetical protein LIO95_05020 [Clostridiales bacterium]|nr:hypothetical protein [Clostridiales bacterium]